jgi:hypothetical protein
MVKCAYFEDCNTTNFIKEIKQNAKENSLAFLDRGIDLVIVIF